MFLARRWCLRVQPWRWCEVGVFLIAVGLPAGVQPAPGDVDARARRTVAEARQLAERDQWEEALAKYESALALKPAPKLHYNIAVCHHQLMARTSDPQRHEHHRTHALQSYEAYLATGVAGDDRTAVERLMTQLSSSPAVEEPVFTIPRIDDESPGAATDGWGESREDELPSPTADEASASKPDAPPPSAAQQTSAREPDAPPPAAAHPPAPSRSPRPPRVQIFGALGTTLAHPGELSNNDDVDGPWTLGGSLQVVGLLGPRRRVQVGGELGLSVAPTVHDQRHRFSVLRGSVVTNMTFLFGRFELALGGVLGVVGEALTMPSDPSTAASCPVDKRTASRRGGGLLGARAGAGVRLGARRRHILALRVTPTLLVTGPGSHAVADECTDGPSAFREFGLSAGSAFAIDMDVGYGIRF